ncbi:DUF192 domain-containing protein [Thermococcus argininiproducens]|uniref:UPF0127 protein K1720_10515 n=1 Tax=Thermococcus argininiproducens TaxID=2866384 RepID=A0A9E7M9P2_9EURY|nr:DUF192 domain-containing protein [Thermococcus argininiproducens]USG99895.1 DUF192 domain-containing protein [Thermococcus argininiproducens]
MLINKTKNQVWNGRVKVADTFFKRFKGLMLTPNIDHALLFILPSENRIRASIHMFFMLQSIDVIFLDSSRRVVDLKRAKPWRVYVPKEGAKYIIETPVGVINVLNAEIGDEIDWKIEEDMQAIPSPVGALNKINVKTSNGVISLADPKPKLKEK